MSRLRMFLACLAISQVFLGGIALSQGPVVDSVSPAQNELNVAPGTGITARFSEPIDQATIDSSTFLVCGEFSGPHRGTISYDVLSLTATLDPYHDFAAGEQVTVVLTSGITSLIESPTSQQLDDYMWFFTVAAATAPSVYAPPTMYIRNSCTWCKSRSIVAADVDGDHDLDLTAPGYGTSRMYVLINNGDGVFEVDTYVTPRHCSFIAAGDLNADDATDMIISSFEQSEIVMFISNGDGTFAPYVSDTVPNAPGAVKIADFDLDGYNDLLTVYPSIDSITIHFGVGDGTFAGTQSFAVTDPCAVVAADLDNDGGLDIAVTSVETDSIEVLLMGEIASPNLSRRIGYQAGEGPARIVAADLNGDHFLDLTTADSGSNDVSVLLNDPDHPGTFLGPLFYAALDPMSLDAVDIDGDGDLDIAVANASGDVAQLLWNDGDGVFVSSTEAVVGYRQQDVIGADFDGDSDIDLAFSLWTSRLVSVALNRKWMFVDPMELSSIAVEGAPGPPVERHISVDANDQDVQFYVADDADWLTEVPSSGTAPADVTVFVDGADLVAGEYTGSIEISADVENSPQTVNVYLTVYPPGTLPGDYIRVCVDSIAAGTVNAEIPFVIQRLCPEPERIMGISNGFILQAAGEVTWEYRDFWFDYGTLIPWFNLGGPLLTNGFDDVSPDIFLVGGAAMPPGGMPVTSEHYSFALYLDVGPGEGEILIDSAFVFSAGYWSWSGLTCGWGGAPKRPLFLAKDSSDLVHPIGIRIYAVCGDVDRSAQTDIDDVAFLIAYLFMGSPAPNPEYAGDVDCSNRTDIDDIVYLMSHIFGGGPCDLCD